METQTPQTRVVRTDDPDTDAIIGTDRRGRVRIKLFPAMEYVLYDEKGMPTAVLIWPAFGLDLAQRVAGYQRVNHNVADACREFLSEGIMPRIRSKYT